MSNNSSFAILTNGLGIVRHIVFTDNDGFKKDHPELAVEKKMDSPDEDKSVGDVSSLVPVLSDFFPLHPGFHPDTFLGDSSFNSASLYGFLLNNFHLSRALIPYNPRNESSLKKAGYNEYGYPTCPNDPSFAMKYLGVTKKRQDILYLRKHGTADVFLAGIASQLTVIVAHRMHCPEYIRNLKP